MSDYDNYKNIIDKLDVYRDISSDTRTKIKGHEVDHGILFTTWTFGYLEEKNFSEILGVDSSLISKNNLKKFSIAFFENILNYDEIKDDVDKILQFFNKEIESLQVKNVLYRRGDQLLYLNLRFNSILNKFMIISIDDVTDSLEDKLILEQLAVDNMVLVKEVHHRVKNNLQILLSLINLQEKFNKSDKSIKEYMKMSLLSMAIMHNQLYSDNLEYISSDKIMQDFKDNIDALYGAMGIKFVFSSDCNVYLSIDKTNPLLLILNELIINSIKHAFSDDDEEKIISCSFRKEGDNLIIKYEDNGKGLPETKGKGLGSYLIETLVKQADGTSKLLDTKGYGIELTIPIDKTE